METLDEDQLCSYVLQIFESEVCKSYENSHIMTEDHDEDSDIDII